MNQTKIFQDCNHPNIIKYIDSFLFKTCFCIVLEGCGTLFVNTIFQSQNILNFVNRSFYIRTAIQILEATQYLHSKNYLIKGHSQRSILIGLDSQVKFIEFGLSKQYNPVDEVEKFENPNNEFFIASDVIQMAQQMNNKNQLVYEKQEDDIWYVGIILYLLAGATKNDVLTITKGNDRYAPQLLVEEDINIILESILKRNLEERIKLPHIIQSFKELQKIQDYDLQQTQDEDCIYKNALQELFNHNYSQTLNKFMILIEKFPLNQNDKWFSSIGFLYFMIEDFEQSIVWSEKALKFNRNNWIAQLNLGKVYLKMNILKQSKICLKKAKTMCKDTNHNILLSLGELYFQQKKYDKTLKIYSDNIEQHPNYLKLLKSMGSELETQQQLEMSIKFLEKYLEIKKKKISANLKIGVLYFRLGDYFSADKYFFSILDLDPSYMMAYKYLGMSSTKLKKYSKSIDYLQIAIELEPKNYITLRDIGLAYKSQQCHYEALIYFQMALEINPKDEDTILLLAEDQVKNLNYDKGIYYYLKLLEINPESICALHKLSQIYMILKNYHMVKILLKKTFKFNQNYKSDSVNITTVNNIQFRYEEGISFCKKGIKSFSNSQSLNQLLKQLKQKI